MSHVRVRSDTIVKGNVHLAVNVCLAPLLGDSCFAYRFYVIKNDNPASRIFSEKRMARVFIIPNRTPNDGCVKSTFLSHLMIACSIRQRSLNDAAGFYFLYFILRSFHPSIIAHILGHQYVDM